MEKIYGLIIYACVFGITLGLIKNGSGKRKANGGSVVWNVSSIVAILLVCIFSAMRAETVGTDTALYLKRYNMAQNLDFLKYFMMVWEGKEIGFVGLTYGVYKITKGNVYIYLFILQLLSTAPVYYGLSKYKGKNTITIAFFVYLLIYFPLSFNIIRQAIAAAFVFLGYLLLKNEKRLFACIMCMISLSFHQSAFIGIILISAVIIFEKINNGFIRKVVLTYLFLLITEHMDYLYLSQDVATTMDLTSSRKS